ncbi:F-box/FBD/LRR-repeat protein At1g13570-like [Rhododendron vialii]|uniref:F-box/FBD/LRR-repeat protein At1g13570-like n=1 Tax=Rhododendron vialii TaxID=182163 RepID=UPI00265E32F4|nr:F-box/FBD/LRR-repeat protein At1g13570-like [Rhododendron vialii]
MRLCSIPVVELLILDPPYAKCLAASGVRERLLTTLKRLTYLQLHNVCFGEPDEVSAILYFFRSCPNLFQVVIRVKLFDLHAWSDVSLNNLGYVYLEEVSGTKAEMEFIKLLLAKSPMLETMYIKLKSKDVAEELMIVKELNGFPRLSPYAVITFGI